MKHMTPPSAQAAIGLAVPIAFASLPGAERQLAAGMLADRPGKVPTHLGAVVRGWMARRTVALDGGRHILRLLLPGDVFGLELLTGQPAIAAPQALTQVNYLAVPAAEIETAYAASDGFRLNILALLGKQQAETEAWLTACLSASAEQRMAILLLDLHARLVSRDLATPDGFVLPLTQLDLASALGLHGIHVNRVLARLRSRKLIATAGQFVTILDKSGLEAVAAVA